MEENKNEELRIALEEMRRNLSQILDNGNSLDQKVSIIVAITGVILAIFSTLQLNYSQNHTIYFWIILVLSYITFISAVSLSLISIMPKQYKLPLGSKWENLDKYVFNKPEKELIMTLLSGYCDVINENENINKCKGRFHVASIILIIVTIGLLLLLVIL
jgi:hypothetical protein